MKKLLILTILFFSIDELRATIYHSSGSGNWDSIGLPNNIGPTDTIYIDGNHMVTIDYQLTIFGKIFISSNAKLESSEQVIVETGGYIENSGHLILDDRLLIYGSLYNSGELNANSVTDIESDGVITNHSTATFFSQMDIDGYFYNYHPIETKDITCRGHLFNSSIITMEGINSKF